MKHPTFRQLISDAASRGECDPLLIQLGIDLKLVSLEQNLFDDYAVMMSENATEDRKLEIAINMFMDANILFEEAQLWQAGQLAELAMQPETAAFGIFPGYFATRLYSSYYAEEDLTSDLIGFWVAYERHRNQGTTSQIAYDEVRRLCRAVNDNNDTSNSLSVYRETYAGGANLQTHWENWYPRLIPLNGCDANLCNENERIWPDQFQSITNLYTPDDKERGWVWHSRLIGFPEPEPQGISGRPNVFKFEGFWEACW